MCVRARQSAPLRVVWRDEDVKRGALLEAAVVANLSSEVKAPTGKDHPNRERTALLGG
jgi:hypothetical protein